ncbi:MAG: hypothetical protein WAR83_13100 [Flavobacteriales bacterium]
MKHIYTVTFLLFTTCSFAQIEGIYVSDAGNFNIPPWQIIKYDENGENPSQFIGTNLNWPQDILFLEDSDEVLISNFGTNKINRHNASNGAYINDFTTDVVAPTRMKIGSDGTIYVLQWNGTGRVKRYALDGTSLGDFTSVEVPQSIGLAWDASGNLYVSSYTADLVRKFDPQGNDLGIFIDSDLVGPTNIWFNSDGDLLVADYDGGAIKRFGPDGEYLGIFIPGLANTEGVDLLPNGNLLLGDGGTHSVKMFNADGDFLSDLIPSGSGGLITPNAVVVRQVSQVSVDDEGPTEERSIVRSATVGTLFQFENSVDLISIAIHTIEGALLEEVIGNSWNANGRAEGAYMVIATWKDGTRTNERIEVVH